MFTVDPSYPFASFVNAMIRPDQYMRSQCFIDAVKMEWPGDSDSAPRPAGMLLQGSNKYTWNKCTIVQQLIYQWYSEGGRQKPNDLDNILAANAGPSEAWNWSYQDWADHGFININEPFYGNFSL